MSQNLNSLAPNFVNKYETRKVYAGENGDWCKKPEENCHIETRKEYQENCHNECDKPLDCNDSFGFGWLGVLILWFIIFTVLFWLIFYSLAPSWTLNQDGTINTGKVLLASIIAAIILVIIIWLIKSCIDYSR